MRPRIALAAAACLAAFAAPARADTVVRGFATASAGVSDNATFQVGANAQRVTSLLFEVRPGVAAIVTEKRDQYLVGYALRFTIAAAQDATQTYANTFFARWAHEASPRDRLLFDANVAVGRTSAFYLVATSGGPLGGATPQVTRFATGTVRESWARQLSPRANGYQVLTGSTYLPLDADAAIAHTWQVENVLAVERLWKRDALRFDLGTSLIAYGSVPALQLSSSQQVLGTLSARWRRDLALRWQSDLSVGVAAVAGIDSLGSPQVGPLASATLRRLIDDGAFSATVSHSEAANLYFAQTQVIDEASLNATVPLDRRRRFRGLATTAYGHSHNVTGTGLAAVSAAYHYYRLDAGVLYVISNGLRTSVHVQRLDQEADASTPTAPSLIVDSVFVDFTVVLPQPEVIAGAPF